MNVSRSMPIVNAWQLILEAATLEDTGTVCNAWKLLVLTALQCYDVSLLVFHAHSLSNAHPCPANHTSCWIAGQQSCSAEITRALAVTVASLLIGEQLKHSSVLGVVAEAMTSPDQNVMMQTLAALPSLRSYMHAASMVCPTRCLPT